MNSTITFPAPTPPSAPPLKLTRSSEKWSATLAEERRRLQEDQDALRDREANLRDYEARLRAWQTEIDAGRAGAAGIQSAVLAAGAATSNSLHRPSSRVPFDDPALQAAWDKLHRARELLEAEQVHLRTDRDQMRELQETLKRQKEEIAAREAKLAEREALVTAAMPASAQQPIAGEHTLSVMTRLTRAPFDMARTVFGGK
ncbi:MAG TPA: hypothetical protein VM029_15355 [Opitutaceae bacterium]|nr:hypothetical protein [Opitutaceae bacterium]